MSDFWAKARGITPRPARPTGVIPDSGRLGAPRIFTQPNQNLAVPPPSPQNQQLQQFYDQGFNDNHVPQWVKDQPTDLCPNCNGADYLITRLNSTSSIGHCYLCGYSSNRRMSDGQVGNAMSPQSNAPATSTRQTHGMKNFGLATPNV